MTHPESGLVADVPVDLTEEALLRLLRNGATVLGHETFDRYREGWFNALATMAGMLGYENVAAAGWALGADRVAGEDLYDQAQGLLGPAAAWPKNFPPE
jgi:hypothetical protein